MRLTRILVIAAQNAMHSVLFVTLCLSTLCIARKMHTTAAYSDGGGDGAAAWASWELEL